MNIFAVPVPLFDYKMEVLAYYFAYQKSDSSFGHSVSLLDGAMDSPLLDIVNDIGLDALTTGKKILIPISHILLLTNIEEKCNEKPENIVFIIDSSIPGEEVYLQKIEQLKSMGYEFALTSKSSSTYPLPLIKKCDYIFVSLNSKDLLSLKYYVNKNTNQFLIISDIDTREDFDEVSQDTKNLLEGKFYRLPVTKGETTVAPIKVNYIRLLNIVNDENYDIDKVAKIVQQDAALAISLLRMVNNLNILMEVKSINHATAMLGQDELRKWITTAVTKMLSDDKPNEITKLSLIRAKFAENLSKEFFMAIHAQNLFLMGLFSALDIILEVTMEKAMDMITMPKPVRNALLLHTGDFYKVLEVILSYENADWSGLSRLLIVYNLKAENVIDAYFDALAWYGKLINISSDEDFSAQEGDL